ncbi:uncharacterized protein LOC129984629 [Argiope bruennichi]|uniref:uncharacterized protein LOC129984629 n=1 Tax=Argiope bruennichi TaxID=94029 RepID=UPI0024951BEE|nr:uncharacterized protein LOC129984629 [Argiope bruennichi]
MDKGKKDNESQSSTAETVPLLGKREPVDLYTEPSACASEPTCGQELATAGTYERAEASPPDIEETMLEADISRKRREVEEELAESINSYEGMADVISPDQGCGLFYGIWLCVCHCLSSFGIQFPLHVLLLVLPISAGFMGARYMTECPMSAKLPYALMVVGGVGTLVLLVRLTLLLHTKFSSDDRLKKWLKTGTKLLECAFLPSLICELCFSYKKSPNDDPFSSNHCNQNFYSFVSLMNNVFITLVIGWIFLYCITGQRCLRRSSTP